MSHPCPHPNPNIARLSLVVACTLATASLVATNEASAQQTDDPSSSALEIDPREPVRSLAAINAVPTEPGDSSSLPTVSEPLQ